MDKKFTFSLLPIVLLVCVNTGFQSTEKHDREPAVNFKGTVNGETAENITVAGLYEDIPFYDIPLVAETAPTANVTHIRLDDIKALRHTPGKESIKQFQKRDYITFTIEFENGKTKPYLVERSRKIYYVVPFSDSRIQPLEKEILFEALQELTIQGYQQRARKDATGKVLEKSAAKEAICTQAKANLSALETESHGMFSQLTGKIKEAVNYLCS